MGCVPSEKKNENLSAVDYRILWNKCLKVEQVMISPVKKTHHKVFTQISKDIGRSFPGNASLNNPQNKKIFQKVLRRFALQFPKVGYTQGLNFIAGFLLINNLKEEQCLKSLIALCTNSQLMLIGLFEDQFPLIRLECELFWIAAKKICPQIYTILKNSNLPNQLWIFQWFLTLFIYSFPQSYIPDFLTFIVVKRNFAAVRLAVAIVQTIQKYLLGKPMKEDGLLECFQLLKSQQFCLKFLPINSIIKRAQKISNQTMMSCLEDCTPNNWYRSYFSMPPEAAKVQYLKRMNELQNERQDYHKQAQLHTKFTRKDSSMTIIDDIEQNLIKRYESIAYRTSVDRNTVFFSRLSLKKYKSGGNIIPSKINS